jgi:hypothetical protein
MAHLRQHARDRHAPPTGQLLRYRDGRPITRRRYDQLWQRIGRHLPERNDLSLRDHRGGFIEQVLPCGGGQGSGRR